MNRIVRSRAFILLTLSLLNACKESGPASHKGVADPMPTSAVTPRSIEAVPPPVQPTRAQKLRDEMTADELRTIREELAPMHSENRWPSGDQDRYLKTCESAKKDDASINRRLCECTMEVVMNKFTAASEYARHLKDHDGQADDKELSTLFGLCTTAYGD